jgi:hydrogenase maturation protein HypF
LKGTVQGVGFRPFIYHLAQVHCIKGFVSNSGRGVVIEAEGLITDLSLFLGALREHPPMLSRIASLEQKELPVAGYTGFEITASDGKDQNDALIPPDIATCSACWDDILNPRDHHYQYPFTNCTNCGPRFTITKALPYDRASTSMEPFPMCPSCHREYHDPLDRRFHAQPVACPSCGPRIECVSPEGFPLGETGNWLQEVWRTLSEGKIIALKGIGGFHLACDATNPDAVQALRLRKSRKAKPFAVMCRDMKTVDRYCVVGPKERELLLSPEAPIVVLKSKTGIGLPRELAPGLSSLGVMLPYSPLHILLLNGPFPVLVMTSGNYRGLPLVIDNSAAMDQLGSVADAFLLHNRRIINRCDDSLVRVVERETNFLRRSRGYVPHPIRVARDKESPPVLGIGGEMKNSFCLLKDDQAFISQYIGEIDCVEGEDNLLESLRSFQGLIGVKPRIVACDLHPEYASARIARQIDGEALVEVQHHHAHFASCLAEHGYTEGQAIGVILDGTGYGTDGRLWGFEVITGDYLDFRRHYHLAYAPLPGGEQAIREPWRMACSYLITFLGQDGENYAKTIFHDKDVGLMAAMIEQRFNSPLSSGCGRLFDAVSAILGICQENTYEGQAAIELGELAEEVSDGAGLAPYRFDVEGGCLMPGPLFEDIIIDLRGGEAAEVISARFHYTVASAVCAMVDLVSGGTGLKDVVLSGGTWQNPFLFTIARRMLEERGYKVLYQVKVPANDGGIALGQAMVAHWRSKEGYL